MELEKHTESTNEKTSSSPGQSRDHCHLLSTFEDKGIKGIPDELAIHAPPSLLQHAMNLSVRMSRRDEPREVRKLQPIVGESERLGSELGSSHSYRVVENGYLAHLVKIGRRMFEIESERKRPRT